MTPDGNVLQKAIAQLMEAARNSAPHATRRRVGRGGATTRPAATGRGAGLLAEFPPQCSTGWRARRPATSMRARVASALAFFRERTALAKLRGVPGAGAFARRLEQSRSR
mgnify:CR=1 FL=1